MPFVEDAPGRCKRAFDIILDPYWEMTGEGGRKSSWNRGLTVTVASGNLPVDPCAAALVSTSCLAPRQDTKRERERERARVCVCVCV
ncbi:hypothetical protein CGRA01v4_03702 [Colletotrichum graminicola]|nr:hypothetical protein CGRA01v4_03702 [Colletotrichum graminicola]